MECELNICLNLLAEQTFILSLVFVMDCSVSGHLDQLLRENIRNPLSSRSTSAKLYSTQKSGRILNEHCKVQKDSFQSTVSSFNLNSVLSTIPQLFQLVPYVENPGLLSLQGILLNTGFLQLISKPSSLLLEDKTSETRSGGDNLTFGL